MPFGHRVGPFRQEKNGTYVLGAGTNGPIKAASCVRGNVRAGRRGAHGFLGFAADIAIAYCRPKNKDKRE